MKKKYELLAELHMRMARACKPEMTHEHYLMTAVDVMYEVAAEMLEHAQRKASDVSEPVNPEKTDGR
jgi:hypothetical protein